MAKSIDQFKISIKEIPKFRKPRITKKYKKRK